MGIVLSVGADGLRYALAFALPGNAPKFPRDCADPKHAQPERIDTQSNSIADLRAVTIWASMSLHVQCIQWESLDLAAGTRLYPCG